MDTPEDGIPELTDAQKARLRAQHSAIDALAAQAYDGTLDDDGLAATISQLQQFAPDHEDVLDSLHVPDDAGEYRDALVSLLARIPAGWGRWVSCDAGWYPLISQLDASLSALDAGYVVHQVKEKFGTLRFYADIATEDDLVREQFDALIDDAEERSAQVCERCSAPAELCVTERGHQRWYKTLCTGCIDAIARAHGRRYAPASTHEDRHES